MQLKLKLLFLLIPFFIYSQVSSAEIFKCTDAAGTIKYQEKDCHDNENSIQVKVKNTKSTNHSSPDNIETYSLGEPVHKTQPQNFKIELIANKKKANDSKCLNLRRKLKTQKQKLYKQCKNGLNTYCDSPSLTLDRKLNRFYSTDKNGFDSNKYVHFNLNGQSYKSVETPLLKIISDLQANKCRFNMPK